MRLPWRINRIETSIPAEKPIETICCSVSTHVQLSSRINWTDMSSPNEKFVSRCLPLWRSTHSRLPPRIDWIKTSSTTEMQNNFTDLFHCSIEPTCSYITDQSVWEEIVQ
jgi:hypothetical protein